VVRRLQSEVRMKTFACLVALLAAAPALADPPNSGWTVDVDLTVPKGAGPLVATLAVLPGECAVGEVSRPDELLSVTVCHRKESMGPEFNFAIDHQQQKGTDSQNRPLNTTRKLRVQARIASEKRMVIGRLPSPEGFVVIGATVH
jgi:hypothetical protein